MVVVVANHDSAVGQQFYQIHRPTRPVPRIKLRVHTAVRQQPRHAVPRKSPDSCEVAGNKYAPVRLNREPGDSAVDDGSKGRVQTPVRLQPGKGGEAVREDTAAVERALLTQAIHS